MTPDLRGRQFERADDEIGEIIVFSYQFFISVFQDLFLDYYSSSFDVFFLI